MDLSMPGLDGWEATRLLKADPLTRHVIVIVLTAHATDEAVGEARAAGADDVCCKPCLPTELHARIRKLVPAA